MHKFILPFLLLAVSPSCLKTTDDLSPSSGNFEALTTDLIDDAVWALNRSITLTFNNPVDPDSIGFHSIVIRPLDNNQVSGQPVEGMFELLSDSYGNKDHAIRFWPACASLSGDGGDGGLVVGGVEYELILPTSTSGASVLRDTAGHPLSSGLRRAFRTPIPPGEEAYLDLVLGPPAIQEVSFPEHSLNLFSEDLASDIIVTFNQDLEPGSGNLNSSSLWVEYSVDGAFSPTTPDSSKRLPVSYFLRGNCTPEQSEVVLRPIGILPPGAHLRVVVAPTLRDLSGESNVMNVFSDEFKIKDLSAFYPGHSPVGSETMIDEYQDGFLNTAGIDLGAGLSAPLANVRDGAVFASMDFPGQAVAQDRNFAVKHTSEILIHTDGFHEVTDSNNRIFSVEDGVMYLNRLEIEAGSSLRGVGSNPLQIYVLGEVFIRGTLDVSGEDAVSPVTGGNHPEQPEFGASGQCGGGNGGTASANKNSETFRGDRGHSPFGIVDIFGGEGGEGGFQANDGLAADRVANLIVGGGGGGAFAPGPNEAIFFDEWSGSSLPGFFDNSGPDLNPTRHRYLLSTDARSLAMFQGAESGMRGVAGQVNLFEAGGTHGMDLGDRTQDIVTEDGWDTPWTNGSAPPFDYGHPTNGPDGGAPGASVSPSASTCFFGRQFWYEKDPQSDEFVASVLPGDLMTPWAGAGGGASGDTHTVFRKDMDGDTVLDPVGDFWPDLDFPTGSTADYYKGAGGGGGGGQLLVMSLGGITIGPQAVITASGGAGAGGESVSDAVGEGTTTQISGSGGGSGGHIILHSSTGLNLSEIPVNGLGSWNDPSTFLAEASANSVVRAIGGRRGWAYSGANQSLSGASDGFDGNGNFQVGRGGAGGNGVIQVHVPNPLIDIVYHPNVDSDIRNYLTEGESDLALMPYAITSRLNEVMSLFSLPQAFTLIPMYSAESQFQSEWVDTGLANLRQPDGVSSYPIYNQANATVSGLSSEGFIEREERLDGSGTFVVPGSVIASSTTKGVVGSFDVVLEDADSIFVNAERFLRTPHLLVGYDFVPAATVADSTTFEIASAEYDSVTNTMTLGTRVSDGSMSLLVGATPDWEIRSKFFRLNTSGTKDRLPLDVAVRMEFQGAVESYPGSNSPGAASAWSSDMASLNGMRFFRYRVTFDVDALGKSVTLNYEEPSLDYIKVPFAW